MSAGCRGARTCPSRYPHNLRPARQRPGSGGSSPAIVERTVVERTVNDQSVFAEWSGGEIQPHCGRQVMSTRTGISFFTAIDNSDGGSILKSASVAGIVPEMRDAEPCVVT